MKSSFSLAALTVLVFTPAVALAQSPEDKGYQIAKAAEESDDGYGDYTVDGTMILRNKSGAESSRSFKSLNLEMSGDGDRGIVFFLTPKSVKGTALLTHGHKTENDDQWLYLPALKRVKRISSSSKTGSFVGSEFSFEDLSSPELAKYTYKWVADDACPGAADQTCHVVERYPTDKDSGYSKQVVWMDKDHYRGYKVDYFDRKGAHLKTMTVTGYQQFAGKHWRSGEMAMINHQTGKSTVMQWSNYQFKTGLSENDFKSSRLDTLR